MKETFDKAYLIDHKEPESQTEETRQTAHGEMCALETICRQAHRQTDERAHEHHSGDRAKAEDTDIDHADDWRRNGRQH